MAVGVVELFKLINVDKENSYWVAASARTVNLLPD
jgi:hypothetical protein